MRELVAQHVALAWALLAALCAVALLIVILRHIRSRKGAVTPSGAAPSQLGGVVPERKLDGAALAAAVTEAERRGESGRLPGLYFSLAQCRLEAGQTADAEELLRKSIRGAAGAQLKETHARARLALGDLAHRSGDLTTACEHWQIARALFHELKRSGDHAAVESRMLRNGCPTDWVLTDF